MVSLKIHNNYLINIVVRHEVRQANLCPTCQRCNRVTSIDPDDPLTHWLRPGDPDNDPDVTRIKTLATIDRTNKIDTL